MKEPPAINWILITPDTLPSIPEFGELPRWYLTWDGEKICRAFFDPDDSKSDGAWFTLYSYVEPTHFAEIPQ